ncbi:nAD-dependent epimerase/dehydratase [Tritrichomonas foetus]|uniref:NAD-dependent epimerase/dehydratase n=1 Tax=Tritrichomonas foetus TaxID=1144522 RepID=A0A1J4JCB5_9EUKA|nr:nAD-dependent epimerase/dehydratase [Tritrichomonas foetus]|eukprot:OHS95895.1 nAD-dependent epimerase/dehydratase [Tritrichomonas foetus]
MSNFSFIWCIGLLGTFYFMWKLFYYIRSIFMMKKVSQTSIPENHSISDISQYEKIVFITGATGVMGLSTVRQLIKESKDNIYIKVLARKSQKNQKILREFNHLSNFEIVWGDLLDYNSVLKGIQDCNYVLHIGGMVSPMADILPYTTLQINIKSAENIVKAVLNQPNNENIHVCYIGSITELGSRNYPVHWGRTGDPVLVSVYDVYGASKVCSERIFVESGIKKWVIFRQTSILHTGLLNRIDPVIFTVNLNAVLEWCTLEDSGRVLTELVTANLSNDFWCKFYNIGSGEKYRFSNYEFYSKIFETLGMGSIDDIFEPHWFTTRNFHGHFLIDSDKLENILHFRENIPCDIYFRNLFSRCDYLYKIPRFIPFKKLMSFVIHMVMKRIANEKYLGTLDWIKNNQKERISAYFGSMEEYHKIPTDWKKFTKRIYKKSSQLSHDTVILNHGYNEKKQLDQLDLNDLRQAAKFRGGHLVSNEMITGDLQTKLEWKCGTCEKTFTASPALIILGGHWCPSCIIPLKEWNYDYVAKTNPFFAQVWHNEHDINENNIYLFEKIFNEPCYEKKSTDHVIPIHNFIKFP